MRIEHFSMPSDSAGRLIDPEIEPIAFYIHRAEFPFRVQAIKLDILHPEFPILDINADGLCILDVCVHRTHLQNREGKLLSNKNPPFPIEELFQLKLSYLPRCEIGQLFEIVVSNPTGLKRDFSVEVYVERFES
jgi:hypothetical protein